MPAILVRVVFFEEIPAFTQPPDNEDLSRELHCRHLGARQRQGGPDGPFPRPYPIAAGGQTASANKNKHHRFDRFETKDQIPFFPPLLTRNEASPGRRTGYPLFLRRNPPKRPPSLKLRRTHHPKLWNSSRAESSPPCLLRQSCRLGYEGRAHRSPDSLSRSPA